MHELSICGSIADIVNRHAGERRVETVHVRIGQLRQIVPDTLVYCWSIVSAETPLAGSNLEVERVPARIECRACGAVSEIVEFPLALCGSCGGAEVTVVSGEEFLITSLALAEE